MKDDTGEKQGHGRHCRLLPRIALLACIAVVVLSLGVALTPRSPKPPEEPPFSQQARAVALSETLGLRTAAEHLAASAPGAGQARLRQTVTLLTTQARALLSPGQDAAAEPSLQGSPSTPAAAPIAASADALAAELAASAAQRLGDAAAADGGMARLLAAVGTAQLLQASSLSAAVVPPLPAQADAAAPPDAATCASAAPAPGPTREGSGEGSGGGSGEGSGGGVTVARALEAAVRTEQQNVYAYQLALTRLAGGPAKSAAGGLVRHEALLAQAKALSLRSCAAPPPPEAGYALAPSFLAEPAAGLAGLETGTLPVYGDLVALSEGDARRWAISALQDTARRAALWGEEPGPLPGLAADPESFPTLPAPAPASTGSQAG